VIDVVVPTPAIVEAASAALTAAAPALMPAVNSVAVVDPEAEARRRAFWEQVATDRRTARTLRRPTPTLVVTGQLSLFD